MTSPTSIPNIIIRIKNFTLVRSKNELLVSFDLSDIDMEANDEDLVSENESFTGFVSFCKTDNVGIISVLLVVMVVIVALEVEVVAVVIVVVVVVVVVDVVVSGNLCAKKDYLSVN
jgi:hypothetical protein